MAIFMACVFVYVILLTFLGPEYKNKNMEACELYQSALRRFLTVIAHDHDLEEATGHRLGVHSDSSRAGSEAEKV